MAYGQNSPSCEPFKHLNYMIQIGKQLRAYFDAR